MQFKIFSQNMWMLPFWISAQNKQRLTRLISFINSQDFDLIALQEVWLSKDVRRIIDSVDSKYYAFHHPLGTSNPSGLLVLSKQKPSASSYSLFPITTQHNWEERRGKKGFIKLDLEINGIKVSVVNTHLYAAKSELDEHIITDQLNIIMTSLADYPNAMIMGDLNLDIGKNPIGHSFVHDLSDTKNSIDKANIYQQQRLNKKSKDQKRIDHILLKTDQSWRIRSRLLTDPVLSDHYGVIGELEDYQKGTLGSQL